MRRLPVRGRGNVAKRVLLQATAFNLALILRSITKAGTPRGLADLKTRLLCDLLRVLAALAATLRADYELSRKFSLSRLYASEKLQSHSPKQRRRRKVGSDTGC